MIKYVKLTTLDELISEVKEVEDGYQFIWPMRVYVTRDEEGEMRNQVSPYVPHVKTHTVTISKDKIVFIADPIPSLLEYYENNVKAMLPPESVE